MKKGINLELKLKKEQVIPSQEQLQKFVSAIWDNEHQKEVVLTERLKNKATHQTPNNYFKTDLIE